MRVELTMPKAGLTNTEGTITEWLVPEAAKVKKGDIVLRVENEKTSFDFESPAEGILHRLADAGCEIKVGSPMGVLVESEADYQALIGQEEAGQPNDTVVPCEAVADTKQVPALSKAGTAEKRLRATPYARKLAGQYHVSLTEVTGTGPAGRIVAKDITLFYERRRLASSTQERQESLSATLLLDVTVLAAFAEKLCRHSNGPTSEDLLSVAAMKAAREEFPELKADVMLTGIDGGKCRTVGFTYAGEWTARGVWEAVRRAKYGGETEEASGGLEIVDLTGQAVDMLSGLARKTPLQVCFGRITEQAGLREGKITVCRTVWAAASGNDLAGLMRLLAALQRYAECPEEILF